MQGFFSHDIATVKRVLFRWYACFSSLFCPWIRLNLPGNFLICVPKGTCSTRCAPNKRQAEMFSISHPSRNEDEMTSKETYFMNTVMIIVSWEILSHAGIMIAQLGFLQNSSCYNRVIRYDVLNWPIRHVLILKILYLMGTVVSRNVQVDLQTHVIGGCVSATSNQY